MSGGNLTQTLQDLTTLIDFLRSKGVLNYSAHGVTLTLLPEAPPRLEPEVAPSREKSPPKVGKDGLTREQQEEMYGSAMSDTAI